MNYPYIRAWGMMLGSFPSFIECEVEEAERTHAPQTAIYQDQDGNWMTFEDIQLSDTRKRIASLVETMKDEESLTYRAYREKEGRYDKGR